MNEQQYLGNLRQLWQKNWPAHLTRDPVYPFAEILLTDSLREWAKRAPHKPCLIYYGTELTFKQLDELSDSFADFLPVEPAIPVHETLRLPRRNYPGTIHLMSMLARQGPTYPQVEVSLDGAEGQNKLTWEKGLLSFGSCGPASGAGAYPSGRSIL